jgi:hypothetical protein
MRTTVRLSDAVLEQAKAEARRSGQTLTALIEEGLRLVLAKHKSSMPGRVAVPVSKAKGGVLPGIDLNDRGALLDIMEGRR